MATPLANLVHKRYGITAFLLLVNLGFSVWFFVMNFQNWKVLWATSAVLHGIVALLALSVSLRLRNSLLRIGQTIKMIFWTNGIFTILSGAAAYFILVEKKNFFWPLLLFFIIHLLSLIFSMTVRYAIEEDVKKRKVCEFC